MSSYVFGASFFGGAGLVTGAGTQKFYLRDLDTNERWDFTNSVWTATPADAEGDLTEDGSTGYYCATVTTTSWGTRRVLFSYFLFDATSGATQARDVELTFVSGTIAVAGSDVSDLKSWLGIADTSMDAVLARLVSAAWAFANRYCGKVFNSSAAYTEYYDGDGTDLLVLDRQPVTAITSVTADGTAITESTSYDDDGWTLKGDYALIYRQGSWPEGAKNVTVVYTAGYSTPPADVRQAVLEMAAYFYEQARRIGKKSQTIADENTTFHESHLTPSAKAALDSHRRMAL